MKKLLFFACVSIICTSCSKNSFKDERDNKVYKTVKIGNKIWMTENLNFDLDNQGSLFYPDRMLKVDSTELDEALAFYHIDKKTISGLSGIGMLQKFNSYIDTIVKKYPNGWRYYTLEAAKKACPAGWRIPNNEDWLELNSFSKTNEIANIQLDWVGYWKKNYNNPILEIRLGDYFGDERGCMYWSGSKTSNEISIAEVSDNNRISINTENIKSDRKDEMNQIAFCIRLVQDIK